MVDGVQRRILTYIPPHFPTSGAGRFVFLDHDVDSGAFFTEGGWEERCNRMGTALILLAYLKGANDVADVKKRFPIDESRVYCAGHSNGSAMTQLLMERAPDVFAAFGPVGFTFGESVGGGDSEFRSIAPPEDGMPRPVWLIKGEHDIGYAARLDPDSSNARFLRTMCAANGCDSDTVRRYENGDYIHDVYRNAQGVPLVRFSTVRDLPHSYSPEMAQMTWDEFFCRFRRNADGSITYLG